MDVTDDVFNFFIDVVFSVEHTRVLDVLEHTGQSSQALNRRAVKLVD
jgi:hypothetical protein